MSVCSGHHTPWRENVCCNLHQQSTGYSSWFIWIHLYWMSSNARDTPGCGTISALREGRTSLGRQYTYDNFSNDKLGNIKKKNPYLSSKTLQKEARKGRWPWVRRVRDALWKKWWGWGGLRWIWKNRWNLDRRIRELGAARGSASAQGRHFFLFVSLCDIKEMLPAAGVLVMMFLY